MSDLFGGPEGEGPLQPTFRATPEQAAIMLERNSRVYDYIHNNPSEPKLFDATTESGAVCAGANATSTGSQVAPDMPVHAQGNLSVQPPGAATLFHTATACNVARHAYIACSQLPPAPTILHCNPPQPLPTAFPTPYSPPPLSSSSPPSLLFTHLSLSDGFVQRSVTPQGHSRPVARRFSAMRWPFAAGFSRVARAGHRLARASRENPTANGLRVAENGL